MKKKIYIVLSLVTIVSLTTSSCNKDKSVEFEKSAMCNEYGQIDSFKPNLIEINRFPFRVNETFVYDVFIKKYDTSGNYNLNPNNTSQIVSLKKETKTKINFTSEWCAQKQIFDTLKYFYSNSFFSNLQLCLYISINENSTRISNQRVFKFNDECLFFYESNHQNHYFNNKIYPISGNEIVFFVSKSILTKLQNDNLELNEENLRGQTYCIYKKDDEGYKIEQIALKDSLILIKQ